MRMWKQYSNKEKYLQSKKKPAASNAKTQTVEKLIKSMDEREMKVAECQGA